MKLKNFGRVFLPKAISTAMFLLLCGLTALVVTGCDEGMNMAGPVVMGPGEEPAETPDDNQKPSSNGEVKQPDPKPTPKPAPPPHKNDFVGQVKQWLVAEDDRGIPYLRSGPVAGVTLTVASGARTGEQSVTDENGNYRFSDPTGETLQLHLRAEKEGYEPKEAIVHRTEPTKKFGDGVRFSVSAHQEWPQRTPGTILIGHKWPDKVHFILEETVLPHDLTLVIVDKLPKNYAGFYWGGVVIAENENCLLKIIAHELGHAHQHAVTVIERGPTATVRNWENTPEGVAYAKAWAKDWKEVGKMRFEVGRYVTLPIENMTQIAKNFWNIRGKFDNPLCFSTVKLPEEAPNRFRWAQEWLSKKYE